MVFVQGGVIRCQLEEEEEWRHKDHLPVRHERLLCHGLHHGSRQLSDRAVVPWSVLSVSVLMLRSGQIRCPNILHRL